MFKNLKISEIFTSFFGLILTAVILVVNYAKFLIAEKVLKNMSIKTKLISTFLLIGILSINITGWLCYLNSKSTLKKVYTDKLASIRETKKQQIEAYFNQIRNQVITFSEDQMIVDAMNQFKTAFYDIKKDNEITDSKISQYTSDLRNYYDEYLAKLNLNVKDKKKIEQYFPQNDEAIILQYHYIANNLNPTGSKGNLEMAADGSQYSKIHSKYHPVIRDYQERFGYYDIFLVDAQTGHIVYSVFKETDFATNLLTGPYRDTNVARVFKEAQDAPDNEFSNLIDFECYTPSYEDHASFVASPIFDGDRKIGILVFQVPINEINRVMTGNYNWKNEGLGESGETYIVGSDYKMRNDSRFLIEEPDRYIELLEQIETDKEIINQIKSHSTTIMLHEISTEAIEDALAGNTNTKIIKDYRGIPVLSSYTPLNIKGVNWIMLSEIDKKEAFSSLRVIGNRIFLITIAISLLVTIIAFSASENIAGPIQLLVKSTKDIASGDFSKRVVITQKDEIGHLASSFNDMTLKLEDSRKQLQESEKHKRQLLDSLKDGIYQCEPHVEGVFTWVNQACAEMFGYKTTEEMLGTKVKDIYVDPEDRRKFVERLERDGFVKNLVVIFKKKNGHCFYAERTSDMIKDEKGEPILIEGIIRDITERKQAEEQLLKLSQAVEQSSCSILITDDKGIIEYVNPKFSQITGYTFEEAVGKNPRILKSGKQSTEVYREMWETIKSGKEWGGEFCNKKKNGEFYWEYASISPVINDKGVITNFIAVKEDITEHKQAEIELQKYSNQLDETNKMLSRKNKELSIINKISNVVPHSLGLDKTLDNILKKILEVLKAEVAWVYLIERESNQLKLVSCKGLSKKETEILEKNRTGERFYNSIAKTHEPIIIKDVKSDKYLSSTMKVKDGILSIAVTPLISQDKVIGILFLSTRKIHRLTDEDIKLFTMIGSQIGIALDNCLLFEEISNSKMEWEDTFDTISDSICIIDKDFRIVRANRGTLKLVGMEEMKDLLNKYYYEVFHGTDKPQKECPVFYCMENNKAKSYKIHSSKLDKMLRMMTFPRFDQDGRLLNIVLVTRDITEQRKIEEKLRISYKMASLGLLSAGVCHEILNPVNIISSHVQLLLMEVEKGSNTEKDLKSMQDEINRITKITDGLLRFSRKEKPESEDVDMNDLLERIISIVEPDMKLRNVIFTRRFEEELPKVTINSDQIRQVCLNLITNARDAMPEGGTITVSTQHLIEERPPFVRIKFIDTGSGISEENFETIFDPFFTTKDEGMGTGLGLSVAYGIIENHGGKLQVQSEIRKGTTLTIDLPIED